MVRTARAKLGDELASQVHEEFLEFLDSACLDGIWYFDLTGNELWHSRNHPKVLGLDGETLPGDMSWWADRIHPDDYATSQEAIKVVMADPSKGYDCTLRLRHKDGHWVWIRARAAATQGPDGHLRLLGANLDVSEMMGTRRALEEKNRELEAVAKILAHDLKQPLRNVSTYLGLLEREAAESLSPAAQAFMQAALGANAKISQMLSDVLALSSLRQAPASLVDLEAVVAEARYNLSLSDVEFEVGALGLVSGHHGQLVRAFQNLFDNASKFRRSDLALVISIRAQELDSRLVVEVRDNGVGFDEDCAETIFELFSRLDGEQTEGSGIGLSVVRRVMELHNGSVRASSPVGEGATFTLSFPAAATGDAPTSSQLG